MVQTIVGSTVRQLTTGRAQGLPSDPKCEASLGPCPSHMQHHRSGMRDGAVAWSLCMSDNVKSSAFIYAGGAHLLPFSSLSWKKPDSKHAVERMHMETSSRDRDIHDAGTRRAFRTCENPGVLTEKIRESTASPPLGNILSFSLISRAPFIIWRQISRIKLLR